MRGATDTGFIALDGAAPLAAARHALRRHARRRHAPAARRRAPADRKNGASAQPAALRSRYEADRGRLWRASAARDPCPAGGPRGLAVPAHLFERERHRPLCVGGFRRLSGHVRRGLLRRQRHLRYRCVRGRAGRPRARLDAAEPRPVRRRVRSRRPRLGCRSRRRVSRRATTSARCAIIAGRAATGSCCRGFSVAAPTAGTLPKRPPPCRRSGAGKCSTTCAAPCRRPSRSWPCSRAGSAVRRRVGLDRIRGRDDRAAADDSGDRRHAAAKARRDAGAAISAPSAAISNSRSSCPRSPSFSWAIRPG